MTENDTVAYGCGCLIVLAVKLILLVGTVVTVVWTLQYMGIL